MDILNNYLCPVSEGPSSNQLWLRRVPRNHCHTGAQRGASPTGKGHRAGVKNCAYGQPPPSISPFPMATAAGGGEGRQRSNCHRQRSAARCPPDPARSSPGPATPLPDSTAAQGPMLHEAIGIVPSPQWRGGPTDGCSGPSEELPPQPSWAK